VPLDELAEVLARFREALFLELRFPELVELLGRQDRHRCRPQPRTAAREQEDEQGRDPQHGPEDIAYFRAQKSFDFATLARYYHSGFAAGGTFAPGGPGHDRAPRES
jgi:hypothetical protein